MTITIKCDCGSIYNLKNELSGQVVQCPKCGKNLTVNKTPFDNDKFLINQKKLSVSEKYHVYDEQKNILFNVVRPSYIGRLIVISILVLVVFVGTIILSILVGERFQSAMTLIILAGITTSTFVCGYIIFKLTPLRHTDIFEAGNDKSPKLVVLQDKKFYFIKGTFTLIDQNKNIIAKFHKNIFTNIFRKKWTVLSPEGKVIFVAMEDSIILSLLRRILGTFFGLLRTNFIFINPANKIKLGEFNRKLTLFDKYVLDLSIDTTHVIDRRVALALGIMLDTAENR